MERHTYQFHVLKLKF